MDVSSKAEVSDIEADNWRKINPVEFRHEQIRMLFGQLPFILLADAAAGLFLFLILLTTAYNPWAFLWFGILLGSTAIRALMLQRYRDPEGKILDFNAGWKFLLLGAGFSGIVWGTACLVLPTNPSFVNTALICLWLAGLMAGAASTMSVLKEVFFIFVLPASGIYITYVFLRITDNQFILIGATLIYVAFIIPIAMRIGSDFKHTITLKLQNSKLQDKLTTDSKQLEDKEEELMIQRRRQATLQSQKAHVDEKLKTADQNRLLLLDAVQEGIFGISDVGMITFINKSALDLLQYEEDEVIGESVNQLICPVHDNPDSITRTNKAIRASYLTGRPSKLLDSAFSDKNGHMVPVRFSSEPIEKEGKIIGAVVSFADISKQKEMEYMLVQSQKMDALGRLTGGVAHDFNNLLTVIIGNLQFLQRHLSDDERADTLVNKIMNAAKNGSELNNRLLSFSREQALETSSVNIVEMLEEMYEFLDRVLGEEIELELEIIDEKCMAVTDRTQLENGVLNLCVNARDAMPKGGKLTISVKTTRFSESHLGHDKSHDEHDYVELSVSDNGTGIPSDIQKKVFEPFFTTKEKNQGTGLGLSTVYGFLKQSGGNITVDSLEGAWTTFRLFIPTSGKVTAPAEIDQAPKVVPRKYTGTILLVEDDENVRDVACYMLESTGYRVISADNGTSGFREFNANPDIDLVFSDVIMPGGMTGVELAEKIFESAPDMPVLLATGYAEKELKDRIEEHRHIVCVGKPYDTQELPDLINSMIRKKSDQLSH